MLNYNKICPIDILKYVGIIIILTFLIKYLVNGIGYIESIIISLVFVAVFQILISGTSCKQRPKEKFINEKLDIDDVIDFNTIAKSTDSNNERLTNTELIQKRELDAMNKIKKNYKNDMVYTESHPFNTVPLGSQIYGYTFLPPENWFRAYDYPSPIYNYKEKVKPVENDSIDGLLQVDFTAPITKINTEYLSK